jgi:Lrp/AsnC family transcriptional regulator, regulator for asnA, asnC and gidA
MDKLDYLILSELLRDAQMPFSTIAKKLGTSPYTVAKRYEKMKREGKFAHSIVSIDLSKLGYQGKVFLMITNKPDEDRQAIIEALKKVRNVISISEVIGAFNILAIAVVSDLNSIKSAVWEVKKIPGVQNVEVTCIDDAAFPIKSNFGEVLSEKCLQLAKNLKADSNEESI